MMYLTQQEVVPWDNMIPWATEALDIGDGTNSQSTSSGETNAETGLNITSLLINIRSTTSEFIRETGILQDEITLMGQEGVSHYNLWEDNTYGIESIHLITAGGNPLVKSSHRYDGRPVPFGQYNELPNNVIIIGNVPDCDLAEYLRVWATFNISSQSCGIPKDIFERYGRRIVHGAVADSFKMALLKGDVARSSVHLISELKSDYDRAVREAKDRASGLLGGGVPTRDLGDYDSFLDKGGLQNHFY